MRYPKEAWNFQSFPLPADLAHMKARFLWLRDLRTGVYFYWDTYLGASQLEPIPPPPPPPGPPPMEKGPFHGAPVQDMHNIWNDPATQSTLMHESDLQDSTPQTPAYPPTAAEASAYQPTPTEGAGDGLRPPPGTEGAAQVGYFKATFGANPHLGPFVQDEAGYEYWWDTVTKLATWVKPPHRVILPADKYVEYDDPFDPEKASAQGGSSSRQTAAPTEEGVSSGHAADSETVPDHMWDTHGLPVGFELQLPSVRNR